MTKEEIAKLTLEDVETIFGPAMPKPGMGRRDSAGQLFEDIVSLSDPRLNPNNLTREDTAAIIEHIEKNLIGGLTIQELLIENENNYIATNGDSRKITIKGTPGAKFTVTVKDSSDCSVMEDELEHIEIPNTGSYVFKQKFPGITSNKKAEFYEIKLTPQATVKYNYTEPLKVYQYPVKTITLKASMDSAQKVVSVGKLAGSVDSTVSLSGSPTNSRGDGNTTTWTTVISETEDTAGKYYVKNLNFSEAVSKSTAIKKVVYKPNGGSTEGIINLKPLGTGVRDGIISGELKVGMAFRGRVEKTKIVFKSLEVPSCKQKADRFELESTTDLFKGMYVRMNNVVVAEVLSIDCEKNITISKKIIIRSGDKVKFTYVSGGRVEKIISQLNQDGNACVLIGNEVYMPNGMELGFDDDRSVVIGKVVATGSGTSEITLVKSVDVKVRGTQDVTYDFDLSKIVTRKPNIKDFEFEVAADSGANTFNLGYGDSDSNKLTKTHTITKNGSHGTAEYYPPSSKHVFPSLYYYPSKGFIGEDIIKYRVTNDGTDNLVDDDTAINPMSDEKTIRITVK
tara:strand:+ start:689 stop:2389 length:1701 start_codon:yes stop_codon:yes gene_type:complete